MASSILLTLAEEARKHNILRIERRRLRDASDPLQLPEREFVANFQLSKNGYRQVLEILSPHLPVSRRKTAVRNELKILAVLNFYACGSYQRSVGASVLNSVSQPTFSKSLTEVTNAFNKPDILLKFIKFPGSQREREIIMKEFMEKFRFPGIIGCIDGTHVALIRPTDHEEVFINRKNYHSLNVLLISDANLNIIHVDASYRGASHDSYVWNQCEIKQYLKRLHVNGEHCWLLGDSGYAQRPWMMTPILGASSNTPEEHYTSQHCRVRNTVERCIGILKARWRCLLAHRVLHYNPMKSGKIVNACVVLHNIANAQKAPIPQLDHGDVNSDLQLQVVSEARQMAELSDRSRDVLVQRLWTVTSNV